MPPAGSPARSVGRALGPAGRNRVGEGEDRPGGPSLPEPGQGGSGRQAARDDHGGHRGPGGRLEGVLPPFVDLDQIEQDPDHAVHAGQQLGTRRPPGLIERPFEGIGPGDRPVVLQFGLPERPFGRLEPAGGPTVGRLGLGHRRLQLMARLFRLGQALPELVVLAFEHCGTPFGRSQAYRELVQRTSVPFQGVLERTELPPGHGDRLVGTPELSAVPPRLQVGFELRRHLLLDPDERLLLRSQRRLLHLGGLQLLRQPGALGFEGGNHVGVGCSIEGLDEGPLTLAEHTGQAPGPLDHALGPTQRGGQVGLALRGHLVCGPLGVRIELAERPSDLVLGSHAARCGPWCPRRGGSRGPAAPNRRRRGAGPAARPTGRCTSGPQPPGARGGGSGA